ncbi:DUF2125 domain-containing protein [Roseomonas elaeocarpi]|uniref:DUF2125 domain-containing protein n=1 Tax=Roseomonas elaeocarpi TaxID=907779 RepID=A0ABV6JZL9_9PROT
MSRPVRVLRPLVALLVLLALMAAGHAFLWHLMAERLQDGFDQWAQARRAQGWRVEYGAPQRGGWPLSATLRLPDFRLQGAALGLPGGMEWQSPALVLQVSLPWLDALRIEPRGPQRLRLGTLELPFAADRITGRLPLQSGVPPRGGELEAERLRLGLPFRREGLEIRHLQGSLATRSTAIEGENAVTVGARAEDITLPPPQPGEVWPLGPAIAEAGLQAALTGPLPGTRQPPAQRAAAWRDAGGVLELRDVTLRWGQLAASAAATMALDEQLQPMGAGTLRLSGAEEAVAAMSAAGVIQPSVAQLAQSVVRLLARSPAPGEAAQVELPVTLEDRRLSLARLPVTRLPPLAWPTGADPAGTRRP